MVIMMEPDGEMLKGKTALVTGAGSGIGREIAHALARAGARVIVNDLNASGADVAGEIRGEFYQADLSQIEAVRDMARRILETHGPVHVLVNNAGYQHVSPVEEFEEDRFASMVQVMLIAPFQLIKAFVPGMKTTGWGRIINVASIHGMVASPYKSAYVSAKHGLVGLTKTVALELGQHDITVNAICPSYVRTPLVEGQVRDQARAMGIGEEEVISKVMLEPAAIKRLVEPAEIARLALFLVSDDARSITGSAQLIDAGWTAR